MVFSFFFFFLRLPNGVCRRREASKNIRADIERWSADLKSASLRGGQEPLSITSSFPLYHLPFLLLRRPLRRPLPLPPSLPLPLLAALSLSLRDVFKVKPFGQSASCNDVHRCLFFSFFFFFSPPPFLSPPALVCVCVRAHAHASTSRVLKCVYPSRTFGVDPTRSPLPPCVPPPAPLLHTKKKHTDSVQTSSRAVFKNPSRSPWGTEVLLCTLCVFFLCVCATNWQASQGFSCILNVSDVLWCFCHDVRGKNAKSHQHIYH